jgi:predicted phosphoribosyltransferase
MTDAEIQALYSSRSGAGAQLGQQVYKHINPPTLVLGVTPSGVEVAANAAKAMGCKFDVIVTAHVRLAEIGIVGAVAEDADVLMDPEFEPKFGIVDALDEAIDAARRAVKTERLLFRGTRELRSVERQNVVIVDGNLTAPWKALAAVEAIREGDPAYVMIAAPVTTKPVHDKVRARRLQFVCPSVLMDPAGHPRPFGDPQDPSAERLRSIVVAREAA